MITKEQVDNYIDTQFYTPETAHQARIDIKWAIEQMRADIQEGAKLIVRWMKAYEAEKAENERLRSIIAAALAIEATEAWDELDRIRETLEKAQV